MLICLPCNILILMFSPSYKPGHVCIFPAGQIYHQVEEWSPLVHTPDNAVTPGRIGSVFFFPVDSLRILEDKPAGWVKDTSHGRLEEFVIR